MALKIVAAGHFSVDLTPVFPGVKNAGAFAPGRLVNVENMEIALGGSVCNTGLALKFFGADVTFVGKMGNDYLGQIGLNLLKKHNAHENMITVDGAYTSYTVVISPPGVDRTFLNGAGANDTFTCGDLDFDKIKQSDLLHIGYPNLMKGLYQNEGEESIKILKKAKESGVKTSLDMAFADTESEAYKINWNKFFERALPYVDFFVPSVEELCSMMDKKKYQKLRRLAGDNDILSVISIENDVITLADKIISLGAKLVLIKCGSLGMLLKTAGKEKMAELGSAFEVWADCTQFERSFVPDRFLSSTGAGDTSIAAFLVSALSGYPPCKCLEYAAATGASCITAYDQLSGLLTFAEIDEKIKNGWAQNPKV